MLEAFLNVFKIEDLRTKILWTLGLIAVYRIGCQIVIPGVDPIAVQNMQSQGGWLQLADMFSGGAFSRFAIFALGIMPYISSSIIMQLLTAVIPYLEELKQQGQEGQDKINQYTRYLTVVISSIQSVGMTFRAIQRGVAPATWMFGVSSIVTLTAGAVFIMWLGEQISEYGIGNGISLVIYVSIVSKIPQFLLGAFRKWLAGGFNPFALFGLFGALLVLFVIAVWIETADRKVPVKYSRQVRGRKVYGGQQSELPLKVDYSGVIAVIFSNSVMMFPVLLFSFAVPKGSRPGWLREVTSYLYRGSFFWGLIFTGLIIFFCYFYTAISFNPDDVAENLKESGGFVPGRRPGPSTAEYIDRILTRITLVGALVVAFIAIAPVVLSNWTGVTLFFGGTSLLIMVGVGLDFAHQLESQLLMRHYEGFMDSGRVKGRGFG